MALYDMTKKSVLSPIPATTFLKVSVMEREHLQAALRDDISPLGDDLLVIAEEFGEFEGVNRRIDLLCIDSFGALVVVELKRTNDGGHMELQALRYAAMVATNTTFDDVVQIFGKHLMNRGSDPEGARDMLEEHLSDVADVDEEGQFQRSVHGTRHDAGAVTDPDRWRTQDARNTVVVARTRRDSRCADRRSRHTVGGDRSAGRSPCNHDHARSRSERRTLEVSASCR